DQMRCGDKAGARETGPADRHSERAEKFSTIDCAWIVHGFSPFGGPLRASLAFGCRPRYAVDAMLSCIRLGRDLFESRPKTRGLGPIGPPTRVSVQSWATLTRPAGPYRVPAYDLSRRLFSQQAADRCLPEGIQARRIA